MGLILDTSAIVELERKRASWDGVLEKAGEESVYLPAIVWGELMAGVHLADTVPRALKRRARLGKLREIAVVLAFTAEIAEAWAELFADLQRAGTPIPANDLCVAATAKVFGHRILVSSRDEAHYRLVPGVGVLTL